MNGKNSILSCLHNISQNFSFILYFCIEKIFIIFVP